MSTFRSSPCCCPPCWPTPCCPHAVLLPARCPVGSCTALPCLARFSSANAPPCLCTALLVARHPALPAMASLSVLTFDHEGRLILYNTWLEDLQLYLLSDSRDSVSLFDHTSGDSLAPPTTADSPTRSQWLTRDAAARLAIHNHLPLSERAHFGQHKTSKALYDTIVARYSSTATAALGHHILPYLFPELSAFATVKDLPLGPSAPPQSPAPGPLFGPSAPMALLRVLPFDPEGRPVAFDTCHDDLQLYLLSDIRDSVSLFDHVSGAAPAPPATADVSTRSQWLSCDATARLAIRNHLPATECAHFGEHRTALALYDAVVARYSSPTTTALGRLLLPYLFPELSAFATIADLVTHLRTSDARYRATIPAENHFLTLDPTSLTVDLLEQHLLAAETSVVAVGAARGTPRSPFFEGCSPSPLSSSFASAAAADISVPEDVGAASTSAKHRNSKGKGGRGSGGGSGGGGGGSGSGSGGSGRAGGGGGGGGGDGTSGGGGGSGGDGGGSGGSGGSRGGGTSGGRSGPQCGGPRGGRGQQQQRRSET
ncbi:unnamed protein product [Closterium sp. NIES-54]